MLTVELMIILLSRISFKTIYQNGKIQRQLETNESEQCCSLCCVFFFLLLPLFETCLCVLSFMIFLWWLIMTDVKYIAFSFGGFSSFLFQFSLLFQLFQPICTLTNRFLLNSKLSHGGDAWISVKQICLNDITPRQHIPQYTTAQHFVYTLILFFFF